jgi:pyrroline-5-carboxylate reductase
MKKINKTIGLIGSGNMGSAILAGLIKNRIVLRNQIYVYDGVRSKMNAVSRTFGVKRAKNNADLARKCKVIVLAVKPQDLNEMAYEIRPVLTSGHMVISILAGTPIQKLKRVLGAKPSLVRAMPNLGAQAGESITALTGGNRSACHLARAIFSACGAVVQLPERHFDLVTAVSGSGPAYFFLIMELLQKAAERKGIPRQAARALAVQTALGSAQLARQSVHVPEVLRKQVTSKKGTTEVALAFLGKKKFSNIFLGAIDQAVKRARQLSKL